MIPSAHGSTSASPALGPKNHLSLRRDRTVTRRRRPARSVAETLICLPPLHKYYRVRVKIESFFSLLKRVADGYCWSRGRSSKNADGEAVGNDLEPCVAWQNEALCKVIYVNLRLILQWELATAYRMNFLKDTFFPPLPDDDKLVA